MSASPAAPLARLENAVDAASRVAGTAALASYAIAGVQPSIALRPGSVEEIVAVMQCAAAAGLAVVPCGARTKIEIGNAPRQYDVALDLSRLNRISACDPDDLTLSVEPGIRLAEILLELGKHGQTLPLGAPFLTRASVGGTVASGVDGPMRQMYGTARDFVLGMEFITGDGGRGKSGGRVVKNVTGFDMHKPLIGSLGTLAVITRINFRTFPAPQAVRGFVAHFSSAQDAAALRDAVAASPLRPLTLEILSPSAADLFARAPKEAQPGHFPLAADIFSRAGWTLAASFTGTAAVMDRCAAELRRLAECAGATYFARLGEGTGEEEMLHVGAAFSRIREFVPLALASSPAATVVKCSVVPEHLEHALAAAKHAADDHSLAWAALARGVGVIYVVLLPASEDDHSMHCVVSAVKRIHADCAHLGGHSIVPWSPAAWKPYLSIWGPERSDLPLMRKLKSVFDPRGILAPGRFAGGI